MGSGKDRVSGAMQDDNVLQRTQDRFYSAIRGELDGAVPSEDYLANLADAAYNQHQIMPKNTSPSLLVMATPDVYYAVRQQNTSAPNTATNINARDRQRHYGYLMRDTIDVLPHLQVPRFAGRLAAIGAVCHVRKMSHIERVILIRRYNNGAIYENAYGKMLEKLKERGVIETYRQATPEEDLAGVDYFIARDKRTLRVNVKSPQAPKRGVGQSDGPYGIWELYTR